MTETLVNSKFWFCVNNIVC